MFWVLDVCTLPITSCHILYAFSQIIVTIMSLLNMSFLSNVEVRFLLYHRPVSCGVVSRCPGAHYTLRMRREQRWREKEACHVCTSTLAAELIDQLEDRGGLGQSLRSVFVCSCWRPIPLWLGRTINAAFSLKKKKLWECTDHICEHSFKCCSVRSDFLLFL